MNKLIIYTLVVFFSLFLLATKESHADTSINGRWLDYFEEGDSLRIDGGVKVTTLKPKEKAGAYLKTGLWTWNLEKTSLSFKIKVSNWNEAFIITLLVGNGLKFENAATFDIKRRFVGGAPNEWIEVVVPPSAWNIEGVVDWKNINSILLSIADAGTERIDVQIADIKTVPMKNSKAIVSISFDDGMIDTMTGAMIMAKYDFPGSAFIDVTKINQPDFITSFDVKSLNILGWDIGGHNMGKLTQMSSSELSHHVTTTFEYLDNHKTKGSKLYALPNGSRNENVLKTVGEVFPYIFNIDGMSNDSAHITPLNINRHSIDKHTSLALAKTWIDNAIANKEWVIINFHTFSDTWEKEEDWTVADFTALLDYIKLTGIEVKTISEVLK